MTDRFARPLAASATFLLLLAAANAGAADAPTKDEWEPVKALIDADKPEAEQALAGLVQRFPQWPSGQRELAKQRWKHGEVAESLTNAEQALKLDPNEVEAACVQVQALGALGKPTDAYAALDAFTGKDKGGWLHYYGAKVALDAKDAAKAERMLKDAKEKAVNSAPPEFAFLEARLDQAKGDREAAKAALEAVVAANDKLYEGWYELGRVELELADDHPDQAKALVDSANSHFEHALRGRAEDPNTLYGVGYARYARAKLLLQDQDEDGGNAGLRDAIAVLDQAVAKQPDFALAHYVLGNVLVQLGRYADAIPHLRRAEELGVTDRAAQYNLALALEATGDRAAAEAILAKNQAVTPSEQIQVAMSAYHGHEFGLAAKLLEEVAPKLDGDSERQAAVWRFLGHALRQLAEQAGKGVDGGGDENAKAALAAKRDELLDGAAKAYAASGDLKDHRGQDHFLAMQTARGADLGYAAGWRYLGWKSYVSPSGWCAVVGNYGGWLSGGRGVGGAWERHPGHVITWGVLLGLPLLMFIVSFFRRGGAAPAEPRRTPSESQRPATKPPTERTRPPTRSAPASAPERTPARGARTAPPPQKRETEVTPVRTRMPDRQKAETEEMVTPPGGNPATPALERKTPPRKR
jgi:predicted Zn-dependent protease